MREILNNKIYYDKFWSLVKWLKYSDTNNEWLKIFEFDKIQKLIKNFHEKYFDKSVKDEFNKNLNFIRSFNKISHTYITVNWYF